MKPSLFRQWTLGISLIGDIAKPHETGAWHNCYSTSQLKSSCVFSDTTASVQFCVWELHRSTIQASTNSLTILWAHHSVGDPIDHVRHSPGPTCPWPAQRTYLRNHHIPEPPKKSEENAKTREPEKGSLLTHDTDTSAPLPPVAPESSKRPYSMETRQVGLIKVTLCSYLSTIPSTSVVLISHISSY